MNAASASTRLQIKRVSLTNNFRHLLNSQIKYLRYGPDTPGYAEPRQAGYFGVDCSAGIKGTF